MTVQQLDRPADAVPANRWFDRPLPAQRRMQSAVAQRPYLADPNYFRLAYLAAAHSVNTLIRARQKADLSSAPVALPDPRARLRIERLRSDAVAVLSEYERCSQGLKPYEKHLRAFLEITIQPSTTLVDVGLRLLDAEWHHANGEQDVGKRELACADELLGQVAAQAKGRATNSYRVLYNLACAESERTRVGRRVLEESRSYEHVYTWLKRTVMACNAEQRSHIVAWANSDPSLEAARSACEAEFSKALA